MIAPKIMLTQHYHSTDEDIADSNALLHCLILKTHTKLLLKIYDSCISNYNEIE